MKNYIVANWKMNQSLEDIDLFFNSLESSIANSPNERWIAPQAIHLDRVIKKAAEYNISIGSQNSATENSGAYTGELSPKFLKELGCSFVILGHSERRSYYHEDDQLINKKIKKAIENDLKVILCVGETLEEREDNKTISRVLYQIREALDGIKFSENILIAYEPIWAIGTGKTATLSEASEVHQKIREFLTSLDSDAGAQTPILYGGSVKPENIKEFLSDSNINGALVGGASLKAESYSQLCLA